MPPLRLLMSGYFGFDNLGDEAIFEAMVESFRRLQPDVQLEALMANTQRAEKLGVAVVPRKNFGQIVRAIRRSDVVLSGGGGLVQDSTGVGSVAYYLGITHLAHWLGKPTMCYAQGFGPVATPLGRRLCRWLGRSLTLVTLRDEESARDMRSVGLGGLPIYVTADPALLLEPPPAAEMMELLRRHGLTQELGRLEGPTGRHPDSGPLVAVTVRPWPSLNQTELIAGLARFQETEKARYLFLPFHPSMDTEISRHICQQMPGPAQVLGADWSPSQITGLLRCCDMIVGMRLHSLILAAGACVPSLGLSYDPKVERFARRAGAVPLDLGELTAERLAEHLSKLMAGRQQARKFMRERVDAMRSRCLLTAQAALALAAGQKLEQIRAMLEVSP